MPTTLEFPADILARCRGSLLGLAVGDALGTTLEFKSPGTFPLLRDMVGGGPFGLKPGQWTDDTSMALCLGESLLECKGFDARDQMERYCRWWREGYLSATGTCFDIGITVRGALERYRSTGNPIAGSTDSHAAGNGSLMRLAPVPLFFAKAARAGPLSGRRRVRTPPTGLAAVDACRYMAGLIVGALAGASKEELLSPRFAPADAPDLWEEGPLDDPAVDAVAAGSFRTKPDGAIRGTGYVVASLEAALWAFARAGSFEEGALLAVNLGDDADTTGAVYGQLAGAFYGEAGIPARWLERLQWRDRMAEMAGRLWTEGGA